MLCAFAVMAAAGVAYYVLCVLENRRRNKTHGQPDEGQVSDLGADIDDVTDGQNPVFRYTY